MATETPETQLDPVCVLDANGWCARHEMHHRDAMFVLATEASERGEFYRKQWDQHLVSRKTRGPLPQRELSPRPGFKVDKPGRSGTCVFLGDQIFDLDGQPVLKQCPTCSGKVSLKVFTCHHPEIGSTTAKECKGCKHYRNRSQPTPSTSRKFYRPSGPVTAHWISTAQLTTDTIRLGSILPADVNAIAGIPRSGLLPATILATHLHLPLFQLTEEGELLRLGHGSRGRNLPFSDRPGKLLVIDDTVYGGGAMAKARRQCKTPAYFAAVYVKPERANAVDFYGSTLPSPHLLEWNVFNNGPFAGFAANAVYQRGIALDMDGILCEDPQVPDEPEDRLLAWLRIARPRWLPRSMPCRAIITARLERWRPETEAWLAQWHVKYLRLIMHPAERPHERGNVAAWKAKHYQESGCGFMIESDLDLAKEIARLAGLPVVHPDSATVFQ